jgi:hypothetical protein
MKRLTKKSLYWTPRILCLLFAAFLSIFALDVFSEELGFWQTVAALLMHLIPSAAIVGVLAIAWRWEWVGAAAFGAFGLLYVLMMWGRFPLSVYFTISGPLFLIAALFLANWILRAKLQPDTQPQPNTVR